MPTLTKQVFDNFKQNWQAQGKISDRSHLRSWLFDKAELIQLLQNASKTVDYVRFYLYEADLQNEESIGLALIAVHGGSATEGGTDLIPNDNQIVVSFPYTANKEDRNSPLYQAPPLSSFQDRLSTSPREDNQITLEQAQVLIGIYLGTDLDPEGNTWEFPCAKEQGGKLVRVRAFRFPVADLQALLAKPEVAFIRQYLATKVALASLPSIAQDENGLAALVMLGTDADGKDIYYQSNKENQEENQEEEEDTGIYDMGTLCPNFCDDND